MIMDFLHNRKLEKVYNSVCVGQREILPHFEVRPPLDDDDGGGGGGGGLKCYHQHHPTSGQI